MLKKFGSFLLAIWAGFLRLVKSNFQQKESTVSNFYSPEELRNKLQDRAFQLEMIDWINLNLRPLENNDNYLAVALDRPNNTPDISTNTLEKFFALTDEYIAQGTPAHDLGHHVFDALTAQGLFGRDPFIATALRNEINAAFLASVIHDIATGVQHRYVDNKWELNHGEIGAWIFYYLTEGLFSEQERLLGAYMIAAHPHIMTKDGNGNNIPRWNDELFYRNNTPVRLGVWLTRWVDRLSNGGDPATHLARHALATLDGARVGGMDLHSVDWYGFQDALRYMFIPQATVIEVPVIKDGKETISKIPTMLQHLKGYAASALARPHSAYNLHDDLSVSMRLLMDWKIAKSNQFLDIVTNTTGDPDFDLFVNLMEMNSGYPVSPLASETIKMVTELWNLNSTEDKAHWANGFEYAHDSFYEWIELLQTEAAKATDPLVRASLPLMPKLISRVTGDK